MHAISKKAKEDIGIITAKLPGAIGVRVMFIDQYCEGILFGYQLRIVGVALGTPGHRELKEGNIKLLDEITQLNEEDIVAGPDWFEQSTRDKTRPLLTLMRNSKTPSIKNLLSKGI